MGNADKLIRLFIAALIATLFALGYVSGTFAVVLLVVAVVFAATSFINFCPIYKLVGIDTCKVK